MTLSGCRQGGFSSFDIVALSLQPSLSQLDLFRVSTSETTKNHQKVNNARANKRDWNAYVRIFRRCPWTGVDATPQY